MNRKMRSIEPDKLSVAELQQILVGSIAPRPIALVSTIDAKGIANLAPYSFFNVFSSNPPLLIFSSNRRGNDNTIKDTLCNVSLNSELVINVVTADIIRQATLASINYPSDVSEFEKAGFSVLKSDMVKPFRVKESPVQYECKVRMIYHLGSGPGAGNLIFCDILKIHINESIFNEKGQIEPERIGLIGRLGRAFYTETSGESIFRIVQPVGQIGIGFDALPNAIKTSKVLSANDLAALASVEKIRTLSDPDERVIEIAKDNHLNEAEKIKRIHLLAKEALSINNIAKAWDILLSGNYI